MMSVVTARSAFAFASLAEALEVPGRGVAAVHPRQRAVAARLQGQVQVLAHAGTVGHGRHRVGTEVLGMR